MVLQFYLWMTLWFYVLLIYLADLTLFDAKFTVEKLGDMDMKW